MSSNIVGVSYDDANGNGVMVTAATPLPVIGAATGASADQVQGNVASGSTDVGNPVKAGGKYNVTLPTLTDGQRGDVQLDSNGNLRVKMVAVQATATDALANVVSFTTSTNSQTQNAITGVAPYVLNGSTWDRAAKANSTSRITSAAASTNGTSGKASTGTLHAFEAYNTTASVKYLKLYNKASAPTVGTDTPVRTIALAPNARTAMTFPNGGLYFSTGIAYGLTGAAADSDTTALTAGDVVGVNIDYS